MGRFLKQEKPRLAAFKATAPYFTAAAHADGLYPQPPDQRGQPRPFCLPGSCAEENLFGGISVAAMACFASLGIKWHDGKGGKPSNHLCDSQVCCVNFLFPFVDQPEALTALLRPVFPGIRHALPVEAGQFIAFEWIGQQNYLGEKISRNGQRTRGANFTSADAAVLFERADGRRQMVLIEWKYTESYGGAPLHVAASGTDRTTIYAHLYEREDCPLDKSLLPCFGDLFYEPFYQLMRQQFLAHEMERARELGADLVGVLHIAPAHNADFCRVTSLALRGLGDSATGVWQRLVRTSDRFVSVHTEDLFGHFPADDFPSLADWWTYIRQRYAWLTAPS